MAPCAIRRATCGSLSGLRLGSTSPSTENGEARVHSHSGDSNGTWTSDGKTHYMTYNGEEGLLGKIQVKKRRDHLSE